MSLKQQIKKIIPKSVLNAYQKNTLKYISWVEKQAYLKGKSEEYLKKWYKKRTQQELDFSHPKTYTEKQQWLKLYGQSELKTLCSDKWLVRDYIKNKVGVDILIPVIKNNGKEVFTDAFDISYEELPKSFVIQCNHGSGMTFVIKDKDALGISGFKKLQKKLNACLKQNYGFGTGLELIYKDISPVIYITKYLNVDDDLPDYKIMCFNGEPKYVWVDTGRFINHKRSVYNLDFTEAPFNMHTYEKVEGLQKPEKFDEMIALARDLSKDFLDYVRVDFYYAEGQIWFGELSFSSASGAELPYPLYWNEKLGELLKLPIDK